MLPCCFSVFLNTLAVRSVTFFIVLNPFWQYVVPFFACLPFTSPTMPDMRGAAGGRQLAAAKFPCTILLSIIFRLHQCVSLAPSTPSQQRARREHKQCYATTAPSSTSSSTSVMRVWHTHQQATPCVGGTFICAVLLGPADFFGVCDLLFTTSLWLLWMHAVRHSGRSSGRPSGGKY